MRRKQWLFSATTALVLLGMLTTSQGFQVTADSANAPSLVISQFKITSSNGQFITLYNTTSSVLDMSRYQLQYFNSYDLSKATSSKLIALSGLVPPHGYFMVNDSSLLLCYQLTVDSISLGLSSTAGLVEVLAFNQASPGASITPVLQDYVGWSKTAAVGAQTLPPNTSAFLGRTPLNTQNNPIVNMPGSGSWQTLQPDPANACGLINNLGATAASSIGQLLLAGEPPSTFLNADNTIMQASSTAALPVADIGLRAPQITELLPNPTGTGNDSTDEYIELYNPNEVAFDLTGFALQSGITSTHVYTFPAGISLAPHSFTVFYSKTTGLSLSNTSGQVKLLDPFQNSISATEAYVAAKDGQTWALAKGKWYWTTILTPNAANVIKQPVSAKQTKAAASKAKAAKMTSGKVKAAKAVKIPKTNQASSLEAPDSTPIHVWTLALVAGLALLYGAYEYRTDLANQLHQLRQHVKIGRRSRP